MNARTCALSLLTFHLLAASLPARAADSFEPLLTRLPADAHVVVLIDAVEAGKAMQAFMDKVQNTAVVAENPDLKNLFGMQRTMMDSAVGTLRTQMGLDPFRDVHRVALALTLADPEKPGLVAAVSGKFPADLLKKGMALEELDPESRDGLDIFHLEGDLVAWQQDQTIVLASEALWPVARDAAGSADALLARHPSLSAPIPEGFLLRSSAVLPDYVRDLAQAEAARLFSTLLGGVVRLEAEVAQKVSHSIVCRDAAATERARLLMDGWSEVLLGGTHLWRAYAMFFLGIDFGDLAGAPPQLRAALANRAALKKTIDEFFPAPGPKPTVTVDGQTVRFEAPPRMMQGAAFVMGVGAAVAIPAFIKYLHRAKQARNTVQARAVQAALDTYMIEHGSYPSTEAGLDVLVKEGFLKKLPQDAFGRPFQYESTGKGFTLQSLGADGQPGGMGADADLILRH